MISTHIQSSMVEDYYDRLARLICHTVLHLFTFPELLSISEAKKMIY